MNKQIFRRGDVPVSRYISKKKRCICCIVFYYYLLGKQILFIKIINFTIIFFSSFLWYNEENKIVKDVPMMIIGGEENE